LSKQLKNELERKNLCKREEEEEEEEKKRENI